MSAYKHALFRVLFPYHTVCRYGTPVFNINFVVKEDVKPRVKRHHTLFVAAAETIEQRRVRMGGGDWEGVGVFVHHEGDIKDGDLRRKGQVSVADEDDTDQSLHLTE